MPAAEIDPMMPDAWAVRRVVKETPDTFTLALEPFEELAQNGPRPALPDRESLVCMAPRDRGLCASNGGQGKFQPGQFSMVWVFGVGELPISISGDPADTRSLTYTVRSVGAATQALVSRKPGESLGIRGPFGTGWPVEAAKGRDVVVVAGGIGLAPLRPVIYDVLRRKSEYGRLVVLYGARSPRDILFRKELASWAKQKDTQVLSTVDYGGVSWRGRVGVVTSLFKFLRLQPSRTTVMVCGPEIMMRMVARELLTRGLAQEDLYLSMERNMKCAVGFCGHCQWGGYFICKDGPVFPYNKIAPVLDRYEL